MNSTPNPFVRCTVIASISLCLLTTGCNAGSSPSPQTSSSQATSQEAPTPSPSTPSPNGSSAAATGASTSPEPSTWPDVVAQVQSGVGQLTVTTCDAGYTGTGFLVGPDLVVTAAHVVRDASAISIAFGRTSVDATVLGKNDVADIAVSQNPKPCGGPSVSTTKQRAPSRERRGRTRISPGPSVHLDQGNGERTRRRTTHR